MARTPHKISQENSQKNNSSHPKHNNRAVLLGRQAGVRMGKDEGAGGYVDSSGGFQPNWEQILYIT